MKIYFVRHGQTQFNKERRSTGWTDIPLIEEGIEQAKSSLIDIPRHLSIIYSSDLLRCKQTTEIINETLGLPVIYDARLKERNLGSLEGRKWEENDITVMKKDKDQEYDYRPYGGESVEDVRKRVFDFVADIQKKEKDDSVLVVTSAGVICVIHHVLHGKVPEKIHNSSVHEFEFED
jgi:2,3-bisphosphoglycerate-dependent phosphoglycerate mutase